MLPWLLTNIGGTNIKGLCSLVGWSWQALGMLCDLFIDRVDLFVGHVDLFIGHVDFLIDHVDLLIDHVDFLIDHVGLLASVP